MVAFGVDNIINATQYNLSFKTFNYTWDMIFPNYQMRKGNNLSFKERLF